MRLGITLDITEEAVSLVAREGRDPKYGARPLGRAVVRLFEEPLAREILTGRIKEGDRVTAEVCEDDCLFRVGEATETFIKEASVGADCVLTDASFRVIMDSTTEKETRP